MRTIKAKTFHPGRDGNGIRLVVIHSASRSLWSAEKTANYFAGIGFDAPGASAHYAIDDKEVICMVEEKDTAWHAPPVNPFSIGIELCAPAAFTREQWLASEAMLRLCAHKVAEICAAYKIPVKHLSRDEIARGEPGIAGHIDINKVFKKSDHADPGPNFPWDVFMRMIGEVQS